MKEKIKSFGRMQIALCICLSVFLNMAVEAISRKSVISLFIYIFDSPYVFFYNCIIILFTLLPVLFLRRRMFFYTMISLVWIGFGITNSILLIFRTTPFTAVDFLLIKAAVRVLDKYFSIFQMLSLAVLIAAAIVLCVFLFRKAPRFVGHISYFRYTLVVLASIGAFIAATRFGLATGRIAVNFGNIGEAFLKYGFPYCFSNSIFNTGISMPDDYSDEMVLEILYNIEENMNNKRPQKAERPNIIFLQLESFFDPKYLKNITLSDNPLPNFERLKAEYSSGFLRVPSVGAGTANTEFEIITGMNLDFFGPGEYPYKTVLTDSTCESFPYVLKSIGYKTHAIHNNEASFYGRNTIFPNLGFDTFTSVEYMNVEEFTPNGWAKDKYLVGSIMDCLNSTEKEPDYIYTISVQGHGKYPETAADDEWDIVAYNEDGSVHPGYTYYVNQIHEMDMFIGELTERLSEYDEKTVLIMYGDHLPSLDVSNETLLNGDIFQTEYIIWSNYKLNDVHLNLEAYQLGSHVMELLNLEIGIISSYHRFFKNSDDYLDKLKVLQYDMLYGDNEVYGGNTPYQPTDMRMGVKDIVIEEVIPAEEGAVYVKGQNFTEYSVVISPDGKEVKSEYVDGQTLKAFLKGNETEISVAQIAEDKERLSVSQAYMIVREGIDE